jgi:hypothetical protein
MPTAPLLAEVTRLYATQENGYTARDKTAALRELFTFDELRAPNGVPTENLVELGEGFQKALIDYAPTYFEQKAERDAQLDAEQAELLREPTAAERLEAVTIAARNGEAVTAAQFAAARADAQAEADLAEITAAGASERAEAAATSQRVRNKAKAAAKKNPPAIPAELDAAVADAKAAIDRVRAAVGVYRADVARVADDFAAAGIESRVWNNIPSDSFDHDNYASDDGFVVIDGTPYGPQDLASRSIASIVTYAQARR